MISKAERALRMVALAAIFLHLASLSIDPAAALADQDFHSKKDLRLQEKSRAPRLTPKEKQRLKKRLSRRIGRLPKPSVNLYSKWTREYLVFDQDDLAAPPAQVANYFLRSHFSNEPTKMDPRLVQVLLQAAQKFHVQRVDVVSGFRDPKYNLAIRKKGRQVARNSEHTLGHAVDFRLPTIPIERVHAWALSLRLGGVGFYKHSRFIHVDVGRVRYWNGS